MRTSSQEPPLPGDRPVGHPLGLISWIQFRSAASSGTVLPDTMMSGGVWRLLGTTSQRPRPRGHSQVRTCAVKEYGFASALAASGLGRVPPSVPECALTRAESAARTSTASRMYRYTVTIRRRQPGVGVPAAQVREAPATPAAPPTLLATGNRSLGGAAAAARRGNAGVTGQVDRGR